GVLRRRRAGVRAGGLNQRIELGGEGASARAFAWRQGRGLVSAHWRGSVRGFNGSALKRPDRQPTERRGFPEAAFASFPISGGQGCRGAANLSRRPDAAGPGVG